MKTFLFLILIFPTLGFERNKEQNTKPLLQEFVTSPNTFTPSQALYLSPFIAALQSSLASNLPPKWSSDPSLSSCYEFLLAFAGASGAFTSCALINSQPFHFCENCADWYQRSVSLYSQLIQGSYSNGTNGTSCKTFLLESASFSIIDEIYRHMTTDLWAKANCDSCFNKLPGSESGEADYTQFSPCFLGFYELVENFTICMSKSNESSPLPIDPSGSSRSRYDPTNPVCSNCSSIYAALTSKFESCGCPLMDRSSCCRDAIEALNVTQYQWTFANCVPYDPDTVAVLAITVTLVSATVAFYVALLLLDRFSSHPSRSLFGIFGIITEPSPRSASVSVSASSAQLVRGSTSALSENRPDTSSMNTDSVLPTFGNGSQSQQGSLTSDPPRL